MSNTALTEEQIQSGIEALTEAQLAMAQAARHGLHHGMSVFADNSSGRRFGVVEVATHPHYRVIIRTDHGRRFQVIDREWCPWRAASLEALGPSEFEACMAHAVETKSSA